MTTLTSGRETHGLLDKARRKTVSETGNIKGKRFHASNTNGENANRTHFAEQYGQHHVVRQQTRI